MNPASIRKKMFLRSQRNYFDIENMKALEVVKGPASTLHGSDAIDGVVAFVTKDPSDYLKPEGMIVMLPSKQVITVLIPASMNQ